MASMEIEEGPKGRKALWGIYPADLVKPAPAVGVKIVEGNPQIRTFDTGATRSPENHKYDFEAFLSPEVLEAYGAFMHQNRFQRDGSLRDGDNWQKGISFQSYAKSLIRHTFDFWRAHRGSVVIDKDTNKVVTKLELLMAILFNTMGYAHELLKQEPKANA